MFEPGAITRRDHTRLDGVLIFAQVYLVCALVGLAAFYYASISSAEQWLYAACVIHVVIAAWLAGSWAWKTGGLFDLYGLFLIVAILFNGGQIILEAFALNEPGFAAHILPTETVLRTVFLVTLGLTTFHLGALVGARDKPALTESRGRGFDDVVRRDTRAVGWFLTAVAIGPTVFELREAVLTVMTQGYAGLYKQEFEVGLLSAPRVLASFIVPGALFLLAGSRGVGVASWVSLGIILAYAAVHFFLGYRGYPSMALMATVWLWHHFVRPLPIKRLLVPGVALVSLVFPLIATMRTIAGEHRLSWEVVVQALSRLENPLVLLVKELGATMWTVAYTIVHVPDTRPFEYGASYLYALLRLVPNLFWKGTHPSIGNAPSDWLPRLLNPFATEAQGLGYSFIGEAYLNFGWIGGPLLLLLIGAGLGRLAASLRNSSDAARMALAASIISILPLYARSDAGGIIRGLVWYAIAPYIAIRILGMFRPSMPWPSRADDARLER